MEADECIRTTVSASLPNGGHWQKIESNPAVFNELLRSIGVQGAYAKEVYSVDEEYFSLLRKGDVYGFILLLRHKNRHTRTIPPPEVDHSNVYFANQVIPDACATQAILSVVLNAPGLDIGPSLRRFKEFTADFPPKTKGLAMTNFDTLRESHNRLAGRYASQQKLFLSFHDHNTMENAALQGDEDDPFHYIAFVPLYGYMWELDGLQLAPIRLSSYVGSDWVGAFRQELVSRIEKYLSNEDGFVLMAIMQDPIDALLKEKQQQQTQNEAASSEEVHRVEVELENELRERAREQLEMDEKVADFRPFLDKFITLLHARNKV